MEFTCIAKIFFKNMQKLGFSLIVATETVLELNLETICVRKGYENIPINCLPLQKTSLCEKKICKNRPCR